MLLNIGDIPALYVEVSIVILFYNKKRKKSAINE
jgi:hypothetical protein